MNLQQLELSTVITNYLAGKDDERYLAQLSKLANAGHIPPSLRQSWYVLYEKECALSEKCFADGFYMDAKEHFASATIYYSMWEATN